MSPTQRQMDALRFIRGYQLAKGRCPSMQEIAVGIGKSGAAKAGAHRLLGCLRERGLVRRWTLRRPRFGSYQVVEVLTDIPVPRSPSGEPLYFVRLPAKGIEAGTDETPQAAQPAGREPGAAGIRP